MFDQKGRFIVDNYNMKSTFSSFLPGISGKLGIPIWSFYVNRGQGITSFGVMDKNHSIMEFYPAHQAYQLTSTVGFRTFLKVNQEYYEPFRNEVETQKMYIGMNELEIEEYSKEQEIQTNILYYTLPWEELGGLVRRVTFTNKSHHTMKLEILDGMPAVIPYGVDINSIKTMGQTVKAWMQVEDSKSKVPYYRVRVSMEDSSVVSKVEGGNFYLTIEEDGTKLPVIVDPEVVFGSNTALTKADCFIQKSIDLLFAEHQVQQNNMPCGFFGKSISLESGKAFTMYSLIGQTTSKDILHGFLDKCNGKGYFDDKYKEATALTKEITKVIKTKTASKVFDSYCEQTYLDNVLRGGFPIKIGNNNIFYLFSRKHGDIERDYNFFRMLPEFYSQGNGNYRDVNQNRRCDTLFAPFVKDYNIKTFYNLIQLDGYNPLLIQEITYSLKDEKLSEILNLINQGDKESVREFFRDSYTPGNLFEFIHKSKIKLSVSEEEFLVKAVEASAGNVNAEFGEGYWTDHWTYNLDLLESYLAVFPDKEKELLFEDNSFLYYESKAVIKPRSKRYVVTENGIRQYHAIDREAKKEVKHDQVRINYGKGKLYQTNLMTKLVILAINKIATLDPLGMGIEMEGGKPGWYDALNGLPGIFGSSMAETYELHRMLEFMILKLIQYPQEVLVPQEVFDFMESLQHLVEEVLMDKLTQFNYWDKSNTVKESYLEKIQFGVDGTNKILESQFLVKTLESWCQFLDKGIPKAMEYGEGICPTYFAYTMTEYEMQGKVVIPKEFKVHVMPHFLEGPVRFLKMDKPKQFKKDMYYKVKSSTLYDEKLFMYKVNESLENVSFEVGRAKAFTPGWLENESIWLHMEYKYLLEVLKSGLYEEFFEDFKKACVPFLDPLIYGRSPLENSSFIASSANPNERIHGKGFVARLSGSTVEFIHMWQIMMFGKNPFTINEGKFNLKFEPAVPSYLIDSNKKIECTFLGQIKVVYHLDKEAELIPDRYLIKSLQLTYSDGMIQTVIGDSLEDRLAEDVRAGLVDTIDIDIL